jgi:hypothetical protein
MSVLKKDYRFEIKQMKDLVKGIEVIAEQGTAYTDRARTIQACEALKVYADRLANLMTILESEAK